MKQSVDGPVSFLLVATECFHDFLGCVSVVKTSLQRKYHHYFSVSLRLAWTCIRLGHLALKAISLLSALLVRR